MNKKNKLLFVIPLLFPITINAKNAEEIRPFIGFKGGWQISDDNAYIGNNPNDYLLGLYGGLQFSPTLSWDLGYQYHGELKASATQVGVKTALFDSAIRYDWQFSDVMSLYGRVGMVYWDMYKTQKMGPDLKDNGFSPLGEFGFTYQMTPNVSLNTSYQYIDEIGSRQTGQYDSHSVLAGVSYRFGGNKASVIAEDVVENKKPEVILPIIKTMPKKSLASIQFDFDKSNIHVSEKANLVKILEFLNQYPQANVEIIGYTDPKGSNLYNLKLSIERAKNVALFLEKNGISPSRISIEGKGELQLPEDASLSQYDQSRRVDIKTFSFNYEENN